MITAHTLIKNEENYIWYSVMSVVDLVDKFLIWDTGSTDSTKEIIKELIKKYGEKINYKEIGEVNEIEYSRVRQDMLEKTESGWILILDGDEIWFNKSISIIKNKIIKSGDNYESIVVPTINLVGDIFHFQDKEAGKYKFGNKVGHYNLRLFRKNIPGLHVSNEYGKEGFFDYENKPIQNRGEEKIIFLDAPYIHATHLQRSTKDVSVMQRSKKMKYELGIEFPKDYYYPESFFVEKPDIVPNIWKNASLKFKVMAFFETPLRKIKRKII